MKHSLVWKLTLPIVLLFGLVMAGLGLYVPNVLKQSAVDDATANARETVSQFKRLRKYYVENVIKKVVGKSDVKASFNHKREDKTIPLPATLIHDLSALMQGQGTSIKLYSPFPFPNRKDRRLDTFSRQAWDTLQKDPDAVVAKTVERDGHHIMRVAIADKMVSEACVKCHNAHPQTPKTGWRLGDVRGILEVESVIDAQIAKGMTVGQHIMEIVGGLALLVLGFIYFMFQRWVTGPLSHSASIAKSIKNGNLTTTIDVKSRDEVGRMRYSLRTMQETLSARLDDTAQVLGAMAKGDLSKKISADYQGSFSQIKENMNATVDQLTGVISEIKGTAALVITGAEEISQGNAALQGRTEDQASSLEQTASNMEEMTETVKQNAANATDANRLASIAKDHAEKGGNVVGQAVGAMAEINSCSQKIANIIGVIDEIAFQTNLLALNASVEAARAGEHGRGFAVVASEVRNLAQRSANSAKEIKDLIEDSVTKVEDGSRLVDESGKALDEIVIAVKQVSEIIAGIATASQEQSTGIELVNKSVIQMDDMTQQNAAMVEQTSAASETMYQQAQRLTQLMGFFSVGDQAIESNPIPNNGVSMPTLERRTAQRPWKKPMAVPDQPPNPKPRKVAASGGAAEEWQEF